MRYLLLLHIDEGGWPTLSEAEQAEAMARYGAFNQALEAAGAFIGTGRLAPSAAAASIRTIGGRPVTLDGPYAETKEQLGGFYLIEAATREAALDWAERCPAVGHGTVEVREVL